MKKISSWTLNLAFLFISSLFFFTILEIALRIIPGNEYSEDRTNDPYYYIEQIGARQHFLPFYTYKEKVPLRFDHLGYYAPTGGIVEFNSNQLGARWIRAAEQPLEASRVLVLGDSFTYGHGLRYEDSFICRLQMALEKEGNRISFLNFAERGADTEEILRIYRQFKDTTQHSAVLYGLHINDLLDFETSYVTLNPIAHPWIMERSRAYDFIVTRIDRIAVRQHRVKWLNDPARFRDSYFIKELNALTLLNSEAQQKGVSLYVVVLPMLVDLKKNTFDPLYGGIRSALNQNRIEYIDLTECLKGASDQDFWVLPFDQHPNHRANQIFADRLFDELHRREIIQKLVTGEK